MPRDPAILQAFKDKVAMRMEFPRLLLEAYDHAWEFPMPEASSSCADFFNHDIGQVYAELATHSQVQFGPSESPLACQIYCQR